jgi:8-oxo-dGTP pyrophosphatase MutT (NUDIX family)
MLVDIQAPDGRRFEHYVVRLQRVAVGLVVDSGRVLMMRRHRFAAGEWGWELPGGIVDHGEDASLTAGREVEEETGWRPAPMTHLLTFQPMPGMVDTPMSCSSPRAPSESGSRLILRRQVASSGGTT